MRTKAKCLTVAQTVSHKFGQFSRGFCGNDSHDSLSNKYLSLFLRFFLGITASTYS